MHPPSSNSNFFSSLRQVEKRLKTENSSNRSVLPSSPAPPLESNYSPTESLSSPLYLISNEPNKSSIFQDSEPPQAFLSNSLEFLPSNQEVPQVNSLNNPKTTNAVEDDEIDDIERLIQLLGLSDYTKEEDEEKRGSGSGCNSCHCDGGFYEKIVGVKGPKCEKEMQRLEGWIKHFGSGEERREPLRLAHLLLGKAAYILGNTDGGFGGFEFPSTLDDYLQSDPPAV